MKYLRYCSLFNFIRTCLTVIILPAVAGCNNEQAENDQPVEAIPAVPVIPYSTPAVYPHDTTIFTEGLVFHKGLLYESGGAPPEIPFTRSVIGVSDLVTGSFTPKVEIDKSRYFGEGIVFLNNKLYQLTYKNQRGFVYDAATFKKIKEFTYASAEGWGLTTDGKHIIMSDGTSKINFLDPQSLLPVKTLQVSENGMERDRLNELEYINGFIYANIWQSAEIAKIDTGSGKVVGWLNLTSIVNGVAARKSSSLEMNGIAYDSVTGKVFITGKLWPSIYQIEFQK